MNRAKKKYALERGDQITAELLMGIGAFSRLTPNRIGRLTPYLHVRKYAGDETIYEQGDPPAAVYFLLSGTVILFHQENASRRDRIRVVPAGESLGHAALLPATRQMETAVAAEPVTALVLSHADLEMLSIREHAMAFAILQGILGEVLEKARIAFTAYRGLTDHLTAANIIV